MPTYTRDGKRTANIKRRKERWNSWESSSVCLPQILKRPDKQVLKREYRFMSFSVVTILGFGIWWRLGTPRWCRPLRKRGRTERCPWLNTLFWLTTSYQLHCSVRLSPMAENSRLLPPVGVWTVSVPVWLFILSDQLLVVALVGLYPLPSSQSGASFSLGEFFFHFFSCYTALAIISNRYSPPKSKFS